MWEHAKHHPVRYFNGVATFVNIWRSSGVGETVRKTSRVHVRRHSCKFVVKGSWQGLCVVDGAVLDSIESLLMRTWHYFPEVFKAVLAEGSTSARTDLILELVRKRIWLGNKN